MLQNRLWLILVLSSFAWAQSVTDFKTPTPLAPGDTLVIGFLGAWEHWDDDRRAVRRLAVDLGEQRIPHVFVETAGNRKRSAVLQLVRRALDSNGNGTLETSEAAAARIILYGQSFGGAAVLKLARELEHLQVPVLLTVQVDSVGRGDGVIPPNVARAANFFQRDHLTIRGQPSIRAADPARTQILGNFRFTYRNRDVDFQGEEWRALGGSHAKMEHDPKVWARVEQLILDAIRAR